MVRWQDLVETWEQAYDKFKVNREYKSSWRDEDAYRAEQEKLAAKIAEADEKAAGELGKILREAWPEAELVVFDSRMHSAGDGRLGDVLVRGAASESAASEMQAWLEKKTGWKTRVTRLESLPEDVREKFGEKRE